MRLSEYRHQEGVKSSATLYLRKELKTILQDRGILMLFVLVPLVYPIMYTYIYNDEVVRDTPMTVVDKDGSALSRELIRRIDATQEVSIVGVHPQSAYAEESVLRGQSYGYLVIPRGFERRLYTGEQAPVDLECELSGMLHYKNLMLGTNLAAIEMGHWLQEEAGVVRGGAQDNASVVPAPNTSVALFNASEGYASFLIPVVLVLIIQQTMLLGVGMLSGTHRERNPNRRLLSPEELDEYPRIMRILLGKSSAYMMLYIVLSVWVLMVVPLIFRIPGLPLAWSSLLFLLLFLLASTYFSLFFACFIPTRESSILLLAFTSVIFMFLSGVVWPVGAMPSIWQKVSWLIPSTPASHIMVALSTMGADIRLLSNDILALSIQIVSYALLSLGGYWWMHHRSPYSGKRGKKRHTAEGAVVK